MATRKIQTEIALTGEKAFNDQMKALNNNMKNLSAEMKVVTSAYDENASATDKLKARQDLLNQQIDQQEEIVRALNEMYEKQKRELGEDAAATDKYRQAMLNAQAKLNGYKKDLAEVDRELEDVAKSTDKAGDESQQAAPKYERSADAMEKTHAAAKKLGSALGSLVKMGATATIKGFSALGVAATGAAAGLATLGARGFKSLINMSLEAANSSWSFWRLRNSMYGLNRAAEEAKTGLAKIMAPALESFTKKATVLLKEYNKEISKTEGDTKAMGSIMARYIRQGAELIRDEAPNFISAGGGLLTGLTEGITDGADEFSEVASDVVGMISEYLSENADDLGDAAAVLVSTFGKLLVANVPQLMNAGVSMIGSLIEGMDVEDADALGETAALLVNTLVGLIAENSPELVSAGVIMLESFIEGLDAQQLGQTAADLVVLFLTTLLELAPSLVDAGLAFISSLVLGVGDSLPALTEAGRNAARAFGEGLKGIMLSIVEWWQGQTAKLAGGSASLTMTGGAQLIPSGGFATGLDTVPYDMTARIHADEMILKAPLARELRGLGVTNASSSIYGALERTLGSGGSNTPTVINNKTTIEFTGSLAQLARVLQPYIVEEGKRRGTQFST